MLNNNAISNSWPEFSIIIAVYNDWGPLERCLDSLDQQSNCPEFEVIIVDDGSSQTAPDSIRRLNGRYSVTIVRQPHAGIATARNRGIRQSRGRVIVFTDADCRLQANCLSALEATLLRFPSYQCFQLRLIGDCSNLVGQAEELRLIELQKYKQESNGFIGYLNTAGFAIRRQRIPAGSDLFDPAAARGEDTLLLVGLMQNQELPFFANEAVVQHAISLSLIGCFCKDVRSAWLEGRTFDKIAIGGGGVKVRMGRKQLISMLWSMWKTAGHRSIGRPAWFVLVARESTEVIVRMIYRLARLGTRVRVWRSASLNREAK